MVENYSAIESQILSLLNEGVNTFELLSEKVSFGEKTLTTTLESLLSKNILVYDNSVGIYKHSKPLTEETIVLDGNAVLPTTIIRMKDKGIMYVTRGAWYQFPIDFDVRRIIWNIKLQTKTNSTLVDLIKTSVLKERKSKIVQLSEYEGLRNKIVPYSSNIALLLNVIGDDVTDVTILFKIKLSNEEITTEHKGFNLRTEISTKELIAELKLPVAERNYQNIVLNRLYNFSDFIFSKNEIPLSMSNGELSYLKITGVKKMFEFSYFTLNKIGSNIKVKVETYDDVNEAIELLRNLFAGMAANILNENGFICEMSE